jgi:hypothetical protein
MYALRRNMKWRHMATVALHIRRNTKWLHMTPVARLTIEEALNRLGHLGLARRLCAAGLSNQTRGELRATVHQVL